MKAIRAHSFGGPEVLQLDELADPSPGPGQVRVRLHAAGVNPFDTYMLERHLRDQAAAARTRREPTGPA